ncbi:YlbF family regulator [Lederbergia citrea]|uniref:YlbF family regulator n=1 Tax=Lederbergia citrea TaxID=2833581 RepID=A0A942UMJ3_9BACI|nr:YlbF family regulator [Lederbergia citrea]MBS4177239.1 YlbF family regulator [Lederbergia citrea]MBS4203902.1 YlbF family regulator [Lederbergia citrea]MBS4221513.1 YlbF family regulator [Lederbergia citrea]
MLATIESVELLEKAELIGECIIASDIAEKYRFFYHKLQNDVDTRKKIAAFAKMKDLYDDVQRFGRYHPDYKQIMTETRVLKREMDLDENVANFRRVENELQSLLDEVSVLIGRSVSTNVKVPTGNPFFDSGSSCSGGCGSGGGCGCS